MSDTNSTCDRPAITIAIATFERPDELRATLAGLLGLNQERGIPHEILIVDNGPSDRSEAVVESFRDRFGSTLRYVREPRLGLSWARNRAIAEARAPILAFLDDDVDVDPGWLTALHDAYAEEDAAAVGGKAYLVYPSARPSWLDERYEGLLSRVDLGASRRPAQPDELFGVNLSFRLSWLSRVGGFRTDLGRIGRRLLGGEEFDLLERLAREGGHLLYEPHAVVGHRVAPERLRRRWFWSRLYWGSWGIAAAGDHPVTGRELLRSAWYLCRAAGGTAWALIRHGPTSRALFHQTTRVAGQLGQLKGLLNRCRTRKPAGAAVPAVPDNPVRV